MRLRLLLIGGGGDTDTFIGHGGGSGFLKLKEVSHRNTVNSSIADQYVNVKIC